MDIKWHLAGRLTLLALACLLAGSLPALYGTAIEAKRQNLELVQFASSEVDRQIAANGHSYLPARFPDWDRVAQYAKHPGQCIEFRSADAAPIRASCAAASSLPATPLWFLAAYQSLVNDRLTAVEPVYHAGAYQGDVVATHDASETAGRAWSSLSPMLGLSVGLVVALCLVIIGDVFKALSEALGRATAERAELARRLVDSQEQERRHIARELHDEIAQKLAALNALAACVRTSAMREAPALGAEARELEKMASGLMMSLRRTLTYLRPQELDDLGLMQSLKDLVDQHNKSAGGRTTYSIESDGDIEQLRAETSAHVYRIVQEGLNNASKHANARNVRVMLSRLASAGQEKIRLLVVDDGAGPSAHDKPTPSGGAGIIGMRERVMALSGKLVSGPLPNGGFGLQVEFPTSWRRLR